MEDNKLDKLFRDAFNNAEETPSPMIWNEIEAKLEDNKNIVPITKRANWLKYSAAAVVLLTLGIGFQLFNKKEVISERKTVEKEIAQTKKESRMDSFSITPDSKELEIVKESNNAYLPTFSEEKTVKPAVVETKKDNDIVFATAHIEDNRTVNIAEAQASVPTVQITEVEPIRPLIEPFEEAESMYATTIPAERKRNTLVTNVLNKLAENIEVIDSKNLQFSADEEGSIRLDVINSLVKNRFKKKR